MKNIIKKFNLWFRNLMLDDVDKEYDGPLPYHKKFGSKKNPTDYPLVRSIFIKLVA